MLDVGLSCAISVFVYHPLARAAITIQHGRGITRYYNGCFVFKMEVTQRLWKIRYVKNISWFPLAFLDVRMTSIAPREYEPRTQLPVFGMREWIQWEFLIICQWCKNGPYCQYNNYCAINHCKWKCPNRPYRPRRWYHGPRRH